MFKMMFQYRSKKRYDKPRKFKLTKHEKNELRYTAFHHPNPEVQRKCLAVLLLSFLFSASLVALILGKTATTVRNYWNSYRKNGITALKQVRYKKKISALHPYADSIEEDFSNCPPSSIAEAAARIKELTGVKRGSKAVRLFLRQLNFRYRKVAGIPAKADIDKQMHFLKFSLEPLLELAQAGMRVVLFMDAAHFVHGAFLGCLWSIKRVFVKTPSGRRRFNVLGAVNAITKQLHTVCNETYINALSICDLLKQISAYYCGQAVTIVLDNARYQKCALVMACAKELEIELLFLPPYSPNLNLIERLWKFIKKKSLNSVYHEKFSDFRTTIQTSLQKCGEEWLGELTQLLSLRFQMFSPEEEESVA